MLDVDTKDVKRLSRYLENASKRGPKELQRAVIDTRRRSVALINRDIRTEYTVKLAALKRDVFLQAQDKFGFVIRSLGKNISLLNFGARRSPKGVRVKVKKSEGFKLIRSAFIKTINGGRGVFRRARKGTGELVGRLPIERLKGPSASQMLDQPDRLDRVEEGIFTQLRANIERRVDKLLR